MAFTSLSHHLDLEFMREAFRHTRKDGAPGVDGQTAHEYAQALESNLERLLNQAKSGIYRAPPVRRVHIPKGDGGETRPIGVPTLEDKVLQRSVVMLLEQIYEQDFYDCSYGFRPRRSAHQALDKLWEGTMKMRGGWVVEVDIRRFFDELEHHVVRDILALRVRDGVIKRLVGKWLNAGVLEGGQMSFPTTGTPQGGVISPLLANIVLHHVIDQWWHKQILPRLGRPALLVRYADDLVLVFKDKREAERVMAVLPKRLGRFGLESHPDKTRLLDFTRPRRAKRGRDDDDKPGTFDFLGFTHYWGKSRKGRRVIKKKTAATRIRRTLKSVNQWLKRNRHSKVAWQHDRLSRLLRGHDSYFGLTGNYRQMAVLREQVTRLWRKWLNRRSWKARMPWSRFKLLLQRYPLPKPRVVHSIYHAAKP